MSTAALNIKQSFKPLKSFCIEDGFKDAISGAVCKVEEFDSENGELLKTFMYIVDGHIDTARLDSVYITNVTKTGKSNIFTTELTDLTVALLVTTARRNAVNFICLYWAHFRSPLALGLTLLALRDSPQEEWVLRKYVESFWKGDFCPETLRKNHRSLETRKWVDKALEIGTPPIIIASSAAERYLKLIVRECLVTGMESLYTILEDKVMRRLSEINADMMDYDNKTSTSHTEDEDNSMERPNDSVINWEAMYWRTPLHICCPLNEVFADFIFSPLTYSAYLKDSETFTFTVMRGDETLAEIRDSHFVIYRITPFPAGGAIDSMMWTLSCGTGQTSHNTLIIGDTHLPDVYKENFGARLSQPLDLAQVKNWVHGKVDLLVSLYSEDYTPISERSLIEAIQEVWLQPLSRTSLVLLPIDIEDVFSVLLLIQLLWGNVSLLNEKVAIAVVAPTATFLSTTIRLLVDAMHPDVRETMIKTKLYIVGSLLERNSSSNDNSSKKTNSHPGTMYFDSLESLRSFLSLNTKPVLIISIPRDISRGWSSAIFQEYIRYNPTAALIQIDSLKPDNVRFNNDPSTTVERSQCVEDDTDQFKSAWTQLLRKLKEELFQAFDLNIPNGKTAVLDEKARRELAFASQKSFSMNGGKRTKPIASEMTDERLSINRRINEFFASGCRSGLPEIVHHAEKSHVQSQIPSVAHRELTNTERILEEVGIDSKFLLEPSDRHVEAFLEKGSVWMPLNKDSYQCTIRTVELDTDYHFRLRVSAQRIKQVLGPQKCLFLNNKDSLNEKTFTEASSFPFRETTYIVNNKSLIESVLTSVHDSQSSRITSNYGSLISRVRISADSRAGANDGSKDQYDRTEQPVIESKPHVKPVTNSGDEATVPATSSAPAPSSLLLNLFQSITQVLQSDKNPPAEIVRAVVSSSSLNSEETGGASGSFQTDASSPIALNIEKLNDGNDEDTPSLFILPANSKIVEEATASVVKLAADLEYNIAAAPTITMIEEDAHSVPFCEVSGEFNLAFLATLSSVTQDINKV